jgi:hypothetical protein
MQVNTLGNVAGNVADQFAGMRQKLFRSYVYFRIVKLDIDIMY